MPNKEQIYDEKISPLMAQIIGICKEHKIAFLADFLVPNDEGSDLHCSSCLLKDECEPSDGQIKAWAYLRPSMTHHSIITAKDVDGKVVSQTMVAIID